MDYGPFLTASIEAPEPATNIAFKGIAIPLGEGLEGSQRQAVVFDTDLLRYSAGWMGGFVALKGVVFDGEHWAYPRIEGDQVFGNPALPGWGKGGSFTDPRPFIYGPLPRDWAHWKGLYLHGQKVILSFSVGNADVLELPGLEVMRGVSAFSRTINAGKAEEDLVLQVAYERDKIAHLRALNQLNPVPGQIPANASIAVFEESNGAHPRLQGSRIPGATEHENRTEMNKALFGCWNFDEAAGNLARALGHSNRVFRLQDHAWAPGHIGTALSLTGKGFGTLESAGAIDFDGTDVTFGAWIKTTRDGSILAQAPAEGPWVPDGKSLFIRNGKLAFDVGWVGAVSSQRTVATGRWTHVAMTWSHAEGGVELFVDGVKDGAQVLKPRKPTPDHAFRVGYTAANFPEQSFFQGQLDELRIYQRKLDAREIMLLAGGPKDAGRLAIGVVGAPDGARWLTTADGHVRLVIPASATPARFKVLIGRADTNALPRFVTLLKASRAAEDLVPLTRGGPPRWAQIQRTRGQLGPDTGPYAVDRITSPEANPWNSWMRFGGFDFFKDSTRAAICTWSGDVWIVSGLEEKLDHLAWHRVATGLFQPLGLKIIDDQIYVLGRDQITRLHDLNGDGEADFYENFNNDTMTSEHFHEFAMDLQADRKGNLYYMKGARHARDALHPHHGTLIKVAKDGSHSEVVARGFRAPNGLEIAPTGEMFTTDQEGYWMPANRLNRIEAGKFYGNVWSWFPASKPTTHDPPICWIHPRVDRSPSTMAWVTSDRWGPLKDKLLSLSYGVGRIFLVMRETVGGVEQGGVAPLPPDFDTGIMRCRFSPRDGQFYACGLFGWAGNKTQPGGFYRVRYTGQPLRLPCELHVATNGLVLTFTDPLEPSSALDTGNYGVEIWNYKWTENYGSPDFRMNGEKGRDALAVEAVGLSQDAKTVFLKMPGIRPVMQMNVQMNLRAADGTPIRTFVHNTIHTLGERPGESWIGDGARTGTRLAGVALKDEAPGLAFTVSANGQSDSRVARLVALHSPAGASVTPFLPGGPFSARWEGYIRLDLSESYAFHAVGRGKVTATVNGEIAVPPTELAPAGVPNAVLSLKSGLNRIVVTYESPPEGDASLRLFWSNSQLVAEPIPPTMLVHEALNPDVHRGESRRLGRQLFATRLCIRCHALSGPLEDGMPELAAEPPTLDNAGARFQTDWLARWIKQPKAVIPETVMPAVLNEAPAEAEIEAADVAAYLATLAAPSAAGNDRAPAWNSPEVLEAGEANFANLGCVACHVFPGDKKREGDTRRPLAHVKAKWKPSALVEYLRAPGKTYQSTPMPDFQLTAAEAESLAAYVMSRADAVADAVLTKVGDPKRGEQLVLRLGCLNCHAIAGSQKPGLAGRLENLEGKDWRTGCLADAANTRGKAPDFGFDRGELEALRDFVHHDLVSLRQDNGIEFAQRQLQRLRCAACHPRDNSKDFWSAVESANPVHKPESVNPYDDDPAADKTIHRQRPPLTWTGEKLRPEWMEQFMAGKLPYKPRPKLEARMPAFPAYAHRLAAGLAQDHGYPDNSPALPEVDPALAAVGRLLIQKGALGCVDCHAVGEQPALAGADTATINFAHIPERLRKEYYDRYVLDPLRLLPGTMMPKFVNDDGLTGVTAYFGGDARKQFGAIWNAMRIVGVSR